MWPLPPLRLVAAVVCAALGASADAAAASIVFTSPDDGAGFWLEPGGVEVTATVAVEGVFLGSATGEAGIRYLLDGEEQAVEVQDGPYTFTDVPLGRRQLVALLVDGDGVPLGGPGSWDVVHVVVRDACEGPADCVDGLACSQDRCRGGGICDFTPLSGCCENDFDCAEGQACVDHACVGVCTGDGSCDDGDPCTADVCDLVTGVCAATPVPECCATNGDCEDGDPCTRNRCHPATNQCEPPLQVAGCCTSDADCDPGSPCDVVTCDLATKKCLADEVPGCCDGDADCDDGELCTTDACDLDALVCLPPEPVSGCCHDDTDCDDGDSCTTDTCDPSTQRCIYEPTTPGCCEDDADCPEGAACEEGTCVAWCTHPCADPSRTLFVGGAKTSACQEISDPETCALAWHLGMDTASSCYWTGSSCQGCGPQNAKEGGCVDTCAGGEMPGCEAAPWRTIDLGGPGGMACRTLDGDPGACVQAYHHSNGGVVASCWYDVALDECRGCAPIKEQTGVCANDCAPPPCVGDPSRTDFIGEQNAGLGCDTYSGQPEACEAAYFFTVSAGMASCYVALDGSCRACNPAAELEGLCANACEDTEPGCEADPSRTVFVGGPDSSGCHVFDGDATGCAAAYHVDRLLRPASCWFDASDGDGSCHGCGVGHHGTGVCTNTCSSLPVPTCADPTRTTWLGGPETNACGQHNGDPEACEVAYYTGPSGVTACWYDAVDAEQCKGCGVHNIATGPCANTCAMPQCGEQGAGSCCEANGTAGCEDGFVEACVCEGDPFCCEVRWDGLCVEGVVTFGCGECAGGCCEEPPLTCDPGCEADPTRTLFVGQYDESGCQLLQGQPEVCETAFYRGIDGYHSCYVELDADLGTDQCLGCGPHNADGDGCTNGCELPEPTCPADPSRTELAGTIGTSACQAMETQADCAAAFHRGSAGVAACAWIDGQCSGCGPSNAQSGACVDTCGWDPGCPGAPERVRLVGGQLLAATGACRRYDGDPLGCALSYHLDPKSHAYSCFYDATLDECRGCGPNNLAAGVCENECPVPFCVEPEVAFCGDGACDPDETCEACEVDCGACPEPTCGPWQDLDAGFRGTLGIAADGTLWAWGYNNRGVLGDGQLPLSPTATTPVQISTATDWVQVAYANGQSSGHAMALKESGDLYVWGRNKYGQLGIGTIEDGDHPTPTKIGGKWKTMDTGDNWTLAVSTSGQLHAWGRNQLSQLGFSGGDKSSPTLVHSATDWQVVVGGYAHSLGIRGGASGSLFGWGSNAYGELGNGASCTDGVGFPTPVTTPTKGPSPTDWVAMSSGQLFTIAQRANGSLWGFGSNSDGKLGSGDVEWSPNWCAYNFSNPRAVVGGTAWVIGGFAAGRQHAIAVKTDGTLWAWGKGGQWVGGYGDKIVPTQIGADTDWTTPVAAGDQHSLASRTDGTLWAFGNNSLGELGTGGSATEVPVQVLCPPPE